MHVRVDCGLYAGYRIPPYYDSMIAKLIVYGRTREGCIMRLRRALEEMVVEGVKTSIPLHQRAAAGARHPQRRLLDQVARGLGWSGAGVKSRSPMSSFDPKRTHCRLGVSLVRSRCGKMRDIGLRTA